MSAPDQAAIDAAWGDTVARVDPRFTPAAVAPPTSFHVAERLHHDGATSPVALDAMWSAAVARVNAEEGLGPAPSDIPPDRPDHFR